jgi:hypothetical protein
MRLRITGECIRTRIAQVRCRVRIFKKVSLELRGKDSRRRIWLSIWTKIFQGHVTCGPFRAHTFDNALD